jgi:NAD-dependent dihydropyrimidine dehydrogenase PreA subunit
MEGCSMPSDGNDNCYFFGGNNSCLNECPTNAEKKDISSDSISSSSGKTCEALKCTDRTLPCISGISYADNDCYLFESNNSCVSVCPDNMVKINSSNILKCIDNSKVGNSFPLWLLLIIIGAGVLFILIIFVIVIVIVIRKRKKRPKSKENKGKKVLLFIFFLFSLIFRSKKWKL